MDYAKLQSKPSLFLPISTQFPQLVLNPSTNSFITANVSSLSPLIKSKSPNSYPLESGVKPSSRKKRLYSISSSLSVHNTSEKRRVERLNAKIEELYSIISVPFPFYFFLTTQSTGSVINKSKINILMESIKFLRHLQHQIATLREQVATAEAKANKRLGQVKEIVAQQKINYHVLFLQSPVPMAILSTDGQFIDANSQFCT